MVKFAEKTGQNMVKSMTGYGKAECSIGRDKYVVEIRSVNGKSADISLKTQFIPREREMEVRQFIADSLVRGNIDIFVTLKRDAADEAQTIDGPVLLNYFRQISDALVGSGLSIADETLLPALLRMPGVISQQKDDSMSDEQWAILFNCIKEAVAHLDEFRRREGESLRRDILSQVDKIESYVAEVEKYEKERIDSVRERIRSRIAELGFETDEGRLEQEMIYYIEKLDINEEKVRLRQHCRYFRETLDNEPAPGKKIGFIAQEMGREINTTGSKANHAEMQKWVVRMKDELEKIKEQSLNVL